jgi:7-keto-8-aminopelargonate synthetase-like enzyme
MYDALERRVAALSAAGQRRELRALQMSSATTGLLQGQPVRVFCSNDYLGLAQHPEVMAAYSGGGAGAARLISGNRPAHVALEAALSERFGRPATLMSSGYHANLALLSTVLQAGDVVASDALNHASIIDGLRLSKAERVVLPHGDASGVPAGARMAVVEGLYSMNGDQLDLASYQAPGRWLAVDEAHAFGVLGPDGLGAAAAQGVQPDFIVGTLGKAIGVYGAFIIGPPVLRELLLSRGRSFIFTTGLPEPVAAAALVALGLANDARRERLRENTERMRRGLHDLGLSSAEGHHIVPVILGERTMAVAQGLLDRGYFVAGIRPPTVPVDTDRLRITLSAAHTPEQIDGLLDALDQELHHA